MDYDINKVDTSSFTPEQMTAFNSAKSLIPAPTETPLAKPVTLLTSQAGADIVDNNRTKLGAVESSIVPIQNLDTSSFTPEQMKAFEAAKALIPGSPASSKMRSEIDTATSQGGMTADERAGKDKLQSAQDAVTTAAAKARAALDAKDYTSMDYWTNKATADRQQYEKQLADYYDQTKALRQRMTENKTHSEKAQQNVQKLIDIRGQADAFKLQTEEDKFREYEGQTMGFAGGRASEIDIRAQFKLQRMATEANTLLTELGLEQNAREMEGKSVEMQIKFLQDNFELQQNVQDKITEMEDSVFDAAKDLRTEAKDTLGMILDSLQGVNPVEIPAQTRAQIQTIASQVGIPFEVIEQGLKAQHAQQVFDNSMRASQEARLASEPGGGTELAPEDERTLAGAGFLPAEIKDIQRAVNDFGIDAVLKTITDQRKKAAIQKAYGVQAGGEQFLTKQYLSKYYTEDELKTNAAEAGFRSVWTNWTSEKEKYLTYLVEQVELKRQAGLTDKEIFKDM